MTQEAAFVDESPDNNMILDIMDEFERDHRRSNTATAYDPKTREWFDYCDWAFRNEPVHSRHLVTGTKLAKFLFYHAFREKYVKGRKGNHGFNGPDFDDVTANYAQLHHQFSRNMPDLKFPTPADPPGHAVLNTYRAAIYNVWMDQSGRGANSYSWEFIKAGAVTKILKHVKTRKKRLAKARFDEKIDGELSPYSSFSQVNDIEESFWEHGKTLKAGLPGLRNRFIFLMSYSGLLRSESLFLGELSDMFMVQYDRKRDVDPHEIMILQIATGKLFDVLCFNLL